MANLSSDVSQLNPLLTTNLYILFAQYDPSAPLPGPPARTGRTGIVPRLCLPSGCSHLTEWLNGCLTPKLMLISAPARLVGLIME